MCTYATGINVGNFITENLNAEESTYIPGPIL